MKKRRHDSPSSLSSPSPSSSSFSSSPPPDRRKKPSSRSRRLLRRREHSPLPKKRERDKRRRRKKPQQQQHSRRNKRRKTSRRGRAISISPPTDRRSSSSCSSRSISPSRSRSRRRLDDDRVRSRGRRIKRRRSRDRFLSRNRSSCSLCGSSSSDGGGERRSRRSKRSAAESKSKKHEDERVEIIQHYGDDPSSSRSVDSSDAAGRRDAGNLPSNEADCEIRGINDRFSFCYDNDPEFGHDGNVSPPITRLKSVVIVPAGPSDDGEGDLEVLLRQKALANLRKFRRGNPRVDAESGSLDLKLNAGDVGQDDRSAKIDPGKDVEGQNQVALSSEDVLVDCDSRKAGIGGNPDKAGGSFSPSSGTTKKIVEGANENLSTRTSVGGGPEHQNELGEKNAGQTAAGPSAVVDQDPHHKNDGGVEGTGGVSELESKTMTVMRGGEMVQVKYKVYIPKKKPSLARRQLKR